MGYRSLKKFDRSAEFVAARPFAINGQAVAPGDNVTGLLSPLRMRQMFERRHVVQQGQVSQPTTAQPAASQPQRKRYGKTNVS